MNNPTALVERHCNYCNILRDCGLSYGDYMAHVTLLPFLEMADEQVRLVCSPDKAGSTVSKGFPRPSLLARGMAEVAD